MRIIAFVLDPPVIDRILRHIDKPAEPPQPELEFNQDPGQEDWPDLDATARPAGDPGIEPTWKIRRPQQGPLLHRQRQFHRILTIRVTAVSLELIPCTR
jgi:hypothetical protein